MIAWLARRARVILAFSLFAGIVLPDLAALLKPLLPWGVAGLLWAAMMRLDWSALRLHLKRPGILGLGLGWMMLAAPFAAWAIGRALGLSEGLAAGLILMACAPPLMSAPAMALMLGLDASLALLLLVLGTMLVPLTAPVLVALLAELDLTMSVTDMGLRLALLIGGCMGAALLARRILGPTGLSRAAPALDVFSLACLVLFAIAVMDGVAAALEADPWRVLGVVGGAYAASLSLLVVSSLAFLRLGRRTGLTIGYAAGNRNMALMVAALPTVGNEDVWLWFALVQFPIYTLPMLLNPIMAALMRPHATGRPG